MLTLVGSLPAVYAEVHRQAAGVPEVSLAVRTRKGLLTAVDPTVLFQVPGLSESGVALATGVGLLAGVNAHVTHKVSVVRVHRRAVLARVPLGSPRCPLPRVDQGVALQVL